MKAIVLAAGKGSRLQCEQADLPKALRLLEGKPLIQYVLDGLSFLNPEDITIVVGFLKEKVMETLGETYRYVEQTVLDGTAHAALCARPLVEGYDGPVLVCYCDMPLLRQETYRMMFDRYAASGTGHVLLTGRFHPIPEFGRILRDEEGKLLEVVEDSACTPQQRLIDEVNIGLQVMDGRRMWDWLPQVQNDNPKKEFYLTGLVRVLSRLGVPQETVTLTDPRQMLGVNSMEDMAAARRALAEMI